MSSMVLKRFILVFGLVSAVQAVPASAEDAAISRGAYLAKAADCTACHTVSGHPAFAGGLPLNSPFGTIYSANITPDPEDGIGRYSLRDFNRAMREGIAKDGTRLYPAMPYTSYAAISDQDISDLYAYFMKGVPPVHTVPPQTKLSFPFNQRWSLALWDLAFATQGRYEPNKSRNAGWNRGAYLVQSLGHCGACHTPRNLAYAEKGYTESSSSFLSGTVIDNWFAADLRKLNDWSEDDIVSFLKTGHGAGSAAFGSMTQVVEDSTQYMDDADLKAVAYYLRTLSAKETKTAGASSLAQWPGAGLYHSACASCHKAAGQGEDNKYPRLAGSEAVLAADPASLIHLVLEGGRTAQIKNGPKPEKMPAFTKKLTDREIADVLSFIRNSWGNKAPPVSVRAVSVLRRTLGHQPFPARDDQDADHAHHRPAGPED